MNTSLHEVRPSGNGSAEALTERILDLEHELACIARAPATLAEARREYESFADDLASDALESPEAAAALAAEIEELGRLVAHLRSWLDFAEQHDK